MGIYVGQKQTKQTENRQTERKSYLITYFMHALFLNLAQSKFKQLFDFYYCREQYVLVWSLVTARAATNVQGLVKDSEDAHNAGV